MQVVTTVLRAAQEGLVTASPVVGRLWLTTWMVTSPSTVLITAPRGTGALWAVVNLPVCRGWTARPIHKQHWLRQRASLMASIQEAALSLVMTHT